MSQIDIEFAAQINGDADEGTPSSIKLEFEFDWEERPWVFLGYHLSAVAEIHIASIQRELVFAEGAQ